MAQAMSSWIEDLQASEEKLSTAAHNSLKKIAAAFIADSSLDAVQFMAKSMVSSVEARRNIWLHHWKVDQGSQNHLAAFPFAGSKLFGDQVLDPLLVENRDKCKVLPAAEKDVSKSRAPSSFRVSQHSFRSKDGGSCKSKWNKSRCSYPRAGAQEEVIFLSWITLHQAQGAKTIVMLKCWDRLGGVFWSLSVCGTISPPMPGCSQQYLRATH